MAGTLLLVICWYDIEVRDIKNLTIFSSLNNYLSRGGAFNEFKVPPDESVANPSLIVKGTN